MLNTLKLLGALIVLNSALTFQNRWPGLSVRWVPELSIDLTVLILILVLVAGISGRVVHRIVLGACLVLVFGRYLDVTAPALVGRPINLYWDSEHFLRVIAMFLDGMVWWEGLIGLFALLLLISVVVAALNWAIAVIMAALKEPFSRRCLGALTVVMLTVFSAGRLTERLPSERCFALPVAAMLLEQTRFILAATLFKEPSRVAAQSPLVESKLGRLRGADTFVIFFESYGATVFDEADYAEKLTGAFAVFERSLREDGCYLASARVVSSTFGGSSWLAHASFLAGLKIADQGEYRQLLTSARATLADRFAAAGYRRVALMPGLKYAWPEGRFYRFDEIYDAERLPYRGPRYGWWAIPDQFSLYHLHKVEVLRPKRQPLFVFFTTISSHAPFSPLAPYYSNWQFFESITEAPAAAAPSALNRRFDDEELRSAYIQSIRYDLSVLQGYVTRYAPPDALLVVLGDHQPPAFISGREASWQVPVHVLSRNSTLIDAFIAAGFKRGATPDQGVLGGIEMMGPLLLRLLDTAD